MAGIQYIGRNLKTYNISEHCHDHWEFIYCTNGNGVITCADGRELQYNCNQLVIIPPSLNHTNSSIIGFKNIHLTVANWTPLLDEATIVSDNSNKDIYSIMSQLLRCNSGDVHNKQMIIDSYINLLLNLVIGALGVGKTSKWVANLSDSIIDNFQDSDFSIKKAMKNIPLNADYLRKLFLKEKGISPLAMLNSTRISFAEKLIKNNDINHYKIHEIAEMSGFSDPLYFSRVFKSFQKVSPSALSRNHLYLHE